MTSQLASNCQLPVNSETRGGFSQSSKQRRTRDAERERNNYIKEKKKSSRILIRMHSFRRQWRGCRCSNVKSIPFASSPVPYLPRERERERDWRSLGLPRFLFPTFDFTSLSFLIMIAISVIPSRLPPGDENAIRSDEPDQQKAHRSLTSLKHEIESNFIDVVVVVGGRFECFCCFSW